MNQAPPPIDPRNATVLRGKLVENIKRNVPEWSAIDSAGQPDQVSAALVGVFARLTEIVIQRLNRVPDKNFLAFLDLLGVARNPPQPARVPLTFKLATGSTTDAVVPAGTQAAAPPAEGEKDPVIFETERELTVVAATLQGLFTVDARSDLVADRRALLTASTANAQRVFAGDTANEHVLYIGHREVLAYSQIQTLTLDFVLNANASDTIALQWEIWDGTTWVEFIPQDTTANLHSKGTVTFAHVASIPELTVGGVTSRWVRCRLLTPISPGTEPAFQMARAALLPTLAAIRMKAQLQRAALKPTSVAARDEQKDVTRPFQPFGDKPAVGDAFYFGCEEAFSKPGAAVSIDVTVLNPATTTPIFPDLQLNWQTWDGNDWVPLGTSTTAPPPGTGPFIDGTSAFTRSQTVAFILPSAVAPTKIGGVTTYWVRVTIVAGDYGVDVHYVKDTTQPGGFRVELSTLAPPMIGALAIGYQLSTSLVAAQDVLAYNNLAFESLNDALAHNIPVTPFRGFEDLSPALYAGFVLPPTRKSFPNRTLSLYQAPRPLQYGEHATPLHPDASTQTGSAGAAVVHHFTLTNLNSETTDYDLSTVGGVWPRVVAPTQATLRAGAALEVTLTITVPNAASLAGKTSDRCFLLVNTSTSTPATATISSVAIETQVGGAVAIDRGITWEYWNGTRWSVLAVVDGSERLTHPGMLEFLGPSDFAATSLFGVSGYWVRGVFDAGADILEPRLRALALNTTFASQTITVRNEVLGSSDATENQRFRTSRSPVLDAQQLEVREPGPLSDEDIALLVAQSGTGVATVVDGLTTEVWVPWKEMPDFYASGPLDRHYMLDHIAGVVQFGDGVHGRIPPRGAGNVRIARYRTGGGDAGNRAAGTIVQLKTTVPYVEKVFNIEPAAGGFAAETTESLIARAPRTLRHGGRAVTAEDYEDQARLASPEIARAKCVPLRRLDEDPLGATSSPGSVSVIVVPGSTAVKPLPTLELLARAEEYLQSRQSSNARLAVVGPLYVRVDVDVVVALVSLEGASQVEQSIREQLAAFLHPLTGGRDRTGWDFGREPQRSDLYAVIGSVAGVDHVRRLQLTEVEDIAGVRNTGRFLVYSGVHQVTLAFLDA